MGRDTVEQQLKKQQQEQLAEAMSNVGTTVYNVKQQINGIKDSLSSILYEPYEFIDENGVKNTITGKSQGLDNNKQNIYGTIEIFEKPEYKGHPFSEVSRNMPNHFKMYCLVNGVSDKEMLSLAKGSPSKSLAKKLRTLKADFFNMVINKDLKAVEDMYVKIAEYAEKKLPDIMKCDDLRNIPANEKNMILLEGTGSYLEQTLRLNGYAEKQISPEQKQIHQNVNKRLKDSGKKYTLNDVEHTLFSMDALADSLNTTDNPPETDYYFEFIANSDALNDASLSTYSVVNRALACTQVMRETKALCKSKGIDYNTTFSEFDSFKRQEEELMTQPYEEIFTEELDNFTLKYNDPAAELKDLGKRVSKLNGSDAPEEIKIIAKAFEKISKMEKDAKHDSGFWNIKNRESLQDNYRIIIDSCKAMMKAKESQFTDNQYKIAVECNQFARKALTDPKIASIDFAKEAYFEQVVQLRDMNIKTDAIHDNFSKVLKERFTHIDSKNKIRTIEGTDNDPEKGTLGTAGIFESPEFKGHPLREVSRNMFSHFKIYCLTKGLTEDELMSMQGETIPDELHEKLLDMKTDFFDMLIEKDMDRISDMYVSIGKMVMADKERLGKILPADGMSLKNDLAVALKYTGSQSWYSQTISHGDSDETEDAKELVKMIDDKLAKDNVGLTFNQMRIPVQAVDYAIQACVPSKLTDLRSNRIFTGNKSQTIMGANSMMMYMHDTYLKNPTGNWIGEFPDDSEQPLMNIAGYIAKLLNSREDFLNYPLQYNLTLGKEEPYIFIPKEPTVIVNKDDSKPEIKNEASKPPINQVEPKQEIKQEKSVQEVKEQDPVPVSNDPQPENINNVPGPGVLDSNMLSTPKSFPAIIKSGRPANAFVDDRAKTLREMEKGLELMKESLYGGWDMLIRDTDGMDIAYNNIEVSRDRFEEVSDNNQQVIERFLNHPDMKLQIYVPEDQQMHYLSFDRDNMTYNISKEAVPEPTEPKLLQKHNNNIQYSKYEIDSLNKQAFDESTQKARKSLQTLDTPENRQWLKDEGKAAASRDWINALKKNTEILKDSDEGKAIKEFIDSCDDRTAHGRTRLYEFAVAEFMKISPEMDADTNTDSSYLRTLGDSGRQLIKSMKEDGYEPFGASLDQMSNLLDNMETMREKMKGAMKELADNSMKKDTLGVLDSLCKLEYINECSKACYQKDNAKFKAMLSDKSMEAGMKDLKPTVKSLMKEDPKLPKSLGFGNPKLIANRLSDKIVSQIYKDTVRKSQKALDEMQKEDPNKQAANVKVGP